jgi:hypothetical protein
MTHKEALSQLKRLRDWAREGIRSEGTPPWAWYQYVKLMETIDALVAGAEAPSQTASLLPEGARSETHLRLVGASDLLDSALRHQPDSSVPLPM